MPEKMILGKNLRITALDDEGKPVGDPQIVDQYRISSIFFEEETILADDQPLSSIITGMTVTLDIPQEVAQKVHDWAMEKGLVIEETDDDDEGEE